MSAGTEMWWIEKQAHLYQKKAARIQQQQKTDIENMQSERIHRHENRMEQKPWQFIESEINMMSGNILWACRIYVSLPFAFIVDNCFFWVVSECIMQICKLNSWGAPGLCICIYACYSLFGQSCKQQNSSVQKNHDSFCIWYYKEIHTLETNERTNE